MENNKQKLIVKRTEALKQATILKYLENVDLDDEMVLYDTLLSHLVQGDLDEFFLTEHLEGLDEEQRKNLFQLARKYSSLCFCQGDVDCWLDSIEGISSLDLDFVCSKLLSHYDLLLRVAKEGGEDVLKQLMAFQNGDMTFESSVIDNIRNNFINDDILLECLKDISKQDGPYQGLEDNHKAVLCTFPEGTLYTVTGTEEKVDRIPVQELERLIKEELLGSDTDELKGFADIAGYLGPTVDAFEDVILGVQFSVLNSYESGQK